jgi:hypothetical protein
MGAKSPVLYCWNRLGKIYGDIVDIYSCQQAYRGGATSYCKCVDTPAFLFVTVDSKSAYCNIECSNLCILAQV